MEESYFDEQKRLHPIRIRWAMLQLKVEMAWHWIVDGAVWNLDDPENPFLQGYRTKRRIEDEEE